MQNSFKSSADIHQYECSQNILSFNALIHGFGAILDSIVHVYWVHCNRS